MCHSNGASSFVWYCFPASKTCTFKWRLLWLEGRMKGSKTAEFHFIQVWPASLKCTSWWMLKLNMPYMYLFELFRGTFTTENPLLCSQTCTFEDATRAVVLVKQEEVSVRRLIYRHEWCKLLQSLFVCVCNVYPTDKFEFTPYKIKATSI